MVKLVALYRKPEVPTDEFDAKYKEHMDLVAKVPGVRRAEVAKFTESVFGQPDLYLIAEVYFDDKNALNAALQSPEMAAAGKQLRPFSKGISTMYVAEVNSAS